MPGKRHLLLTAFRCEIIQICLSRKSVIIIIQLLISQSLNDNLDFPVWPIILTYLILDGVGLNKQKLLNAPLFTRVQAILETVDRSCRYDMIRKSIPMSRCPLTKETCPNIDPATLHLE